MGPYFDGRGSPMRRTEEGVCLMTQRGRATGTSPGARRGGTPGARQPRRPGDAQRPRGDLAVRRAQVRAIAEPVVTDAGYDLEDLTLSRAGRRTVVRVVVDGDGGVSLDAVAAVSRAVSAALDAVESRGEELFSGEYELQVSSPGVDRPLTLPRHWRRNVGRLVQVRAGGEQVTGRVVAATDDVVTLDIAGERREISLHELGPGKVQLEFNRLAALSDDELEDMLHPIDDDDEGSAGDASEPGRTAVTGESEGEEDEE